jgi:glutaredoxin
LDKEKAREMVAKSRQMGVPVITIDEDVVIGFNQTQLDKLLASNPPS